MNLFKSNPDLLMNGAKRLTERIKAQILGGTLKRDEIISEAKEFYAIFKEHPSIKGILSKILGSGGSSGGSAGGILELVKGMFGLSGDSDDEDETDKKGGGGPSESDRLRAVKERLRKKMSAKTAKK
jgi:hypothetical protein